MTTHDVAAIYPVPGEYVETQGGRRLTVTEVEPGDRLGREIRGEVRGGPFLGRRDYSTDLATFHKVWSRA